MGRSTAFAALAEQRAAEARDPEHYAFLAEAYRTLGEGGVCLD